MPTFIHKDTGRKVFFAHIPRTAGRFVESSLLENNFEWGDSHLNNGYGVMSICLLYTSPSPRDGLLSRMPSSA